MRDGLFYGGVSRETTRGADGGEESLGERVFEVFLMGAIDWRADERSERGLAMVLKVITGLFVP